MDLTDATAAGALNLPEEYIGRILPDGTVTFANGVMCRLFGLPPEACAR